MNDPNAPQPDPPDVSTETYDAAILPKVSIPDRIGPYKILEVLGEGGMGVVYLAKQTKPIRRRVALKLVKLGMDTKQVIARFESERQALALFDHPNVAKVFDAGATAEGRPYFVMEHVAGVPITEYCDRHRLNTTQRLELFTQVCHAVQHAHQKGIIHRDIKPSNVLVAVKEGEPVPKVIDFGVAKATQQRLTEKTIFTEQGQLIGTPEYMSPEQAEMTALDIDTRTDIYSLGVMLYQLLAGALPFDPAELRRAGFAEIQRVIREQEPPKPSTRLSSLGNEPEPQAEWNPPFGGACANVETEPQASACANVEDAKIARAKARGSGDDIARRHRTDLTSLIKQLRGDLDWIIMRAMDKDRTRRYATATAFAEDIVRHLNHEPVTASPPSAGYRFKKFIRRNRGVVAASAVVFIVLVAGVAGTTSQAVVATRQRKLAEQRADELTMVTEFQQSMLSDIDAEEMGRGIIAAQRKGIREWIASDGADSEQVEAALASFDDLVARLNATNLALNVVDEHVLARAVKAIDEEFADQPVTRAALQQTVADTFREIGLYERAMPLQEACLRTRLRELGDDHPDTLSSINNMGVLLWSMGKYAEGEPYLREALVGRRRVLGDDHHNTLSSINNMGALLEMQGKLADAEPYWREALMGRRRVLGDDHPDTLTSIHNMGFLLKAQGKLGESECFLREAMEGYRRVLGDDHSSTLVSIANMGDLLLSMGQYVQAEPYFREALDGRRRVLGDDHPLTLGMTDNMGELLHAMGRYAEAESYFRKALEGRRQVLGEAHESTVEGVGNLGALLTELGRYGEAVKLIEASEVAARRVYVGGTARWLGNHLRKLGAARVGQGAFSAAEETLLESHGLLVAGFGEDHERTTKAVRLLITLYESWDASEPGKGYAEKAAEWRKKLPEEDGE